ncbi:hypothetical protein BCR33DRAFT_719181 [Rhizoclosmatium globosum]|uniref:Uncharacterized protein n=1 Tax=Rhizoclosmatium globosum TaxID=329046 RepID=A0A1Y2C231_9FUNG|nr:hypothetical protein BCR33DRAFT_719181 [Rhizoclosmatium globosum]|eukprot:ORY41102.1 hypothetical protein BCR33DRAFT_719181 [Rhizoclosmatium globosum]
MAINSARRSIKVHTKNIQQNPSAQHHGQPNQFKHSFTNRTGSTHLMVMVLLRTQQLLVTNPFQAMGFSRQPSRWFQRTRKVSSVQVY